MLAPGGTARPFAHSALAAAGACVTTDCQRQWCHTDAPRIQWHLLEGFQERFRQFLSEERRSGAERGEILQKLHTNESSR